MQFALQTPGRGATGPWRRKQLDRIVSASARATNKASIGARDELRAAMRAQRLGNLANAIGATSDLRKKRPQGRSAKSLDVAGFVFARIRSPRTAGALDAYINNDVTEIGPRKGTKWLAIATNEIPRRVGRRRMTPELYKSSGLEERVGPLTFIPGRTAGEAYLVVKDVTIRLAKAGKARRPARSGRVGAGRARVGIVAFVLIRRTRRQRRVAPREVAQRWQQKLPQLLRAELRGRT